MDRVIRFPFPVSHLLIGLQKPKINPTYLHESNQLLLLQLENIQKSTPRKSEDDLAVNYYLLYVNLMHLIKFYQIAAFFFCICL